MSKRGFPTAFLSVSGENSGGMYLRYARNGAESHRSFVPFPHVSRRRVLRGVERGVGHRCPLRPRAATTLSLTRPPISPHPAQIPPSCTTCWVRDGSAGNAGRPSRGLTFSIIFMWWLAAWKVYVVSPLCLVPLLFSFSLSLRLLYTSSV